MQKSNIFAEFAKNIHKKAGASLAECFMEDE